MPVDWYKVITDLQRQRMSYRQIAIEVRVSHQTIANWRFGVTEPSYNAGERLLEVYKTVIPSTC